MDTKVISYQSNNEVYQSVKYSSKDLSKDAYTAARIYNLVGVIEISFINTLAYDFKAQSSTKHSGWGAPNESKH
jgi:uncharacterized membrane protein YjgN (DUF898 family)